MYSVEKTFCLFRRYLSTAVTEKAIPTFPSDAYRVGMAPHAVCHLPSELHDRIHGLVPTVKVLSQALSNLNLQHQCLIHRQHILGVKTPLSPELPNPPSLDYGRLEALAWLGWQFPFVYGTVQRVMHELQARYQLHIESVLDYGAGCGAGLWASRPFLSQLKRVTAVEVSEAMQELHQEMTGNLNLEITYKRLISAHTPPAYPHDLSLVAYTLGDLPDDHVRLSMMKVIWAATSQALVIVDRGTPEAYRQLMVIREWLRKQTDAQIVAPCASNGACPLQGNPRDWCHFTQRIALNPTQIRLGANPHGRGWEDQKYSYLVVLKNRNSLTLPRIIKRPKLKGGHVILDLCGHSEYPEAISRVIVPKSQGKVIYKDARNSQWGDQWPHPAKNKVINLNDLKQQQRPNDIDDE